MNDVTAMSVVVARIMPNNVKKLRSLFLRRESTAILAASQKDALGRNVRLVGMFPLTDVIGMRFVPGIRYAGLSPAVSRFLPSSRARLRPTKNAVCPGTGSPDGRHGRPPTI